MTKNTIKVNRAFVKEITKQKIKSKEKLDKLKREVAKKQGLAFFPSNAALLEAYRYMAEKKEIKPSSQIERLLITRPVRSLSGIVNLTVLTKPYPCPGKCIYCPDNKDFPKSYLSGEPAADRARSLGFSPHLQVVQRLESLQAQGHPIDKIELRIVGGTWSCYERRYQTNFVKECFAAANRFKPGFKAKAPESGLKVKSLEKVQKENETAFARIVGLSIETRPDFVDLKEIKRLRMLGVTLVELGVQTVFDQIHQKNKTGNTAEIIAKATRLLKNSGFKVLYQVMPGLLGTDLKKDLALFDELFNNESYKPDWLKIYPCVVCPDTELYKIWKERKYNPYSKKKLLELLIKIKEKTPKWIRIARIFRDIPRQSIAAGCKSSNLRELVQKEMKDRGLKCRCVRCREIKEKEKEKSLKILRQDYCSSGGKEIFLSWEDKKEKNLYSLLRLRIPGKGKKIAPLEKAALIREVQTFGPQVAIGTRRKKAAQHKGLGKKLIKEAEKIAKNEFGFKKIAVISGIGARNYYRKLGYRLKQTYMLKNL